MNREHVVWVQRTTSHDWFELCRCETVTVALAILRVLLENPKVPPANIRIEVVDL